MVGGVATGVAATNLQVSQVALYKGSVSDANLLRKISGSNLAAGVATLDSFHSAIAASTTQTYVVTVSFVDGVDALGKYVTSLGTASIAGLTFLDDDNADVNAATGTYPLASGRTVSVGNVGAVTFFDDANNTDNKDQKTILAGTSKVVYSADVQASNESILAKTVKFTVNQNIKNAVQTASLYLGDTLIATNSNADITSGSSVITFENLTTLIIPQSSVELRLALNTAPIGFEKVGQTLTGVTVTAINFEKTEGVDSGKLIGLAQDGLAALPVVNAKAFSIAPAIVTPSVVSAMTSGDRKAKIRFTVDAGSNSSSGSNSNVQIDLTQLSLKVGGAYTGSYNFYVDGQSGLAAVGTAVGGVLTFSTANLDATYGSGVISTSETYVVELSNPLPVGYNASLTLVKQGVQYNATNVDGVVVTTNLANELDLGSASN